ncbi:hypothetical protein H4582DRAFT_1921467 [Lactarius indigo]|nr:hypothetical protein H4582DRAFT_1921467 [Lactarius indigo]
MPHTLHNILQPFSLVPLFVFVALTPFLVLAIPIPPQGHPAFPGPPNPKSSNAHLDHRVIFGIVFVLSLFLIIEIGYACVGFRMPFIWFVKVNNLICAASVKLMRRLSSLSFFSFFEKAADAIIDGNVGASSARGRSDGTGNLSTISRPAPLHARA